VAGRPLVHHGQQELHVLPQEGRALSTTAASSGPPTSSSCWSGRANPETKHPFQKRYEIIREIIVKDDYTVSIALKEVNANFLLEMARQGSVIYPREAVETLKSAPMGTGPFTVADWVRGDRVVLAKNKDYHVKGLPHLDKVTFRFIPDPNSALAALKSGDIDVSSFGLGPENVVDLKKDPRFQVILGDTTNDVILAMNNSKKPYSDKRVRLAITEAINKEEVLKGAMFGLGRILGSNVDPLNPYFVDMSKAVPYDPGKARKLLAEAGYPERLRGRAPCLPAVLLHGAHGRGGGEPARQGGGEGEDRADRVARSGCRRSTRTPATISPSSATPSPGTSPTTPTPATTSGGTTRTSRRSTRSPSRRWTTRSVASSTRGCRR
jgi:ABC-type transport system substrate-binding protein